MEEKVTNNNGDKKKYRNIYMGNLVRETECGEKVFGWRECYSVVWKNVSWRRYGFGKDFLFPYSFYYHELDIRLRDAFSKVTFLSKVNNHYFGSVCLLLLFHSFN